MSSIYCCDICEYTTITKCNLTRHNSNKHSIVKEPKEPKQARQSIQQIQQPPLNLYERLNQRDAVSVSVCSTLESRKHQELIDIITSLKAQLQNQETKVELQIGVISSLKEQLHNKDTIISIMTDQTSYFKDQLKKQEAQINSLNEQIRNNPPQQIIYDNSCNQVQVNVFNYDTYLRDDCVNALNVEDTIPEIDDETFMLIDENKTINDKLIVNCITKSWSKIPPQMRPFQTRDLHRSKFSVRINGAWLNNDNGDIFDKLQSNLVCYLQKAITRTYLKLHNSNNQQFTQLSYIGELKIQDILKQLLSYSVVDKENPRNKKLVEAFVASYKK